MTILSEASTLFDEWIAAVAGAIDSMIGRYAPRPQIVLGGESTGVLTARLKSARKGPALSDISFRISNGRPSPALPADWQAAFRGSRVETDLAPAQVLFRSLDFPRQASDFLDGMIRTQLDRLTPWPADDAVFGWSPPSLSGQERIELTLAATSKQEIEPLVQLAAGLGAQSLPAFAKPPPAAARRPPRGRYAAPPAPRLGVGGGRGRGRAAGGCVFRRQLRFRTAAIAAADLAAAGRAPARPRRELGARPSRQAQTDGAVDRCGAGSPLAGLARRDLRDRASDRRRQGSGDRRDAGCTAPLSPDREIAAVPPGAFL